MLYLFLSLSVLLSTARNLLSKKLSKTEFGKIDFFIYQAISFFSGAVALTVFGNINANNISFQTVFYAFLYGILLIFAQWFHTMSLTSGNTSLCSTIYSMGFIFPTLSGTLFWAKKTNIFDFIGIIFAVLALLFSGTDKKTKTKASKYYLPCLIAMLASGGLGILQKLQQKSDFPNQRGYFLLIAFVFAGVVSVIFALLRAISQKNKTNKKLFIPAAGVGFSFGCCNLLNTFLSGVLPSSFFFPVLNIGAIIATTVMSIILYKEKIKKKELMVLSCGIVSIILLSIF